ncbi:Transcription factor tau subunit [Choanephora cucurbitarum]|uniref:Transcription factor tau subunit n=1 Tax=Choanephora cucurbitarum TaxID=101091 RepID=A0A1C7NI42_9FUNG|nr:Transcription factor tau subunit [Choanephora cucurbitarum]
MGVKDIWVVRHGFREDWVNPDPPLPTGLPNDPPLSRVGRQQAKELADFLSDKSIDRIYSSPFYRVLETVRPFAEATETPVFVDYSMAEWYGKAHDHYLPPALLSELERLFPIQSHTSSIALPEGIETAHDCHVRVKRGIDQLLAKLNAEPHPPKTILLAGHAASAICAVRGLIGDANYPVRCGVCSLSHLVHQDGTWQLVANGDYRHLSEGEQRHWTFSGDVPDYEKK